MLRINTFPLTVTTVKDNHSKKHNEIKCIFSAPFPRIKLYAINNTYL